MKNDDEVPSAVLGAVEQEGEPKGSDDEWEDEDEEAVSIDDILDLAGQTNTLLFVLMAGPDFNKTDPKSNPKPLFFTTDFVRRTYLEYILPLLPKDAQYKAAEIANPFIFDYTSEKPMPTNPNRRLLEDIENYPDLNEELGELYFDAVGRNMMISMAILESHKAGSKGAMVLGGRYEFSEQVKEVVTMIAGGPEVKARIMASRGIF